MTRCCSPRRLECDVRYLPMSPIPFSGLIAIPCGVLALSFGLVGRGRQRLGIATNGGMATIGAGLGVIAIGIGAWWLVVLNDGLDNLQG